MKKGIEDLAYLIKKAKENNKPKPIVFLGAGASVSGGIPLVSGIIKKIHEDFKDKPSITNLSEEKRNDYYELMSVLNPDERKQIFQDYIKKAKINVAHIYLAQLVDLGYIDYVMTVNFDDLLLRACGLFNYTMPTYDISNVKQFTTTSLEEKSLVYLHGQHYGQWLLNAKGELDKVRDTLPILFNDIGKNRTWIVVGYSGEDEIFNIIKDFSSFDNELFWIGYLKNKPNKNVQKELLDVPTKNANLISSYDADTFFLDLHAKLGLSTPQIFDKPFSFLKTMVQEVKVPEEDKQIEDHKDLYNSLSERMDISNGWIDRAISNIEEEDSVEKLKQQIIEAYIKEEFEENEALFLEKIKLPEFEKAKSELAEFYFSWGLSIQKSENIKVNEAALRSCIAKYEESIELNPENDSIRNNYGIALSDLAKLNSDESIYKRSFEEYEKALELNKEYDKAYYNYGCALSDLAKLNSDESLYEHSFEKYEKAIKLNPEYTSSFNNYGIALANLAKLNSDESLYEQSFEKYRKAIELNPEKDSYYNNYGNALSNLAELKSDQSLYERSFVEYEKAIELNPEYDSAHNNYGIALKDLAKLNSDESLYERSFVEYEKAIELNPEYDSAYNSYGIALAELARLNSDESLYERSFVEYEKAIELNPLIDSYHNNYGIALSGRAKLKSDQSLYERSFVEYEKAIELNPKSHTTYNSYGNALIGLFNLNNDSSLLDKGMDVLLKGYDLGGNPYNLSCLYSLQKNKKNAIKYLEETLEKGLIEKDFILKDPDWKHYLDDIDFKALLAKH